jgi:general secretion pathway protein J
MSALRRIHTAAGFTMIELLAAMAIFSLLAVVMYGGVRWIVLQREVVMERQSQLRDLQRAVNLLNNDFGQLTVRPIRDELGRDFVPALISGLAGEFVVELSHDGWRNPAGAARGTLQRVQYRLEEPEVNETGRSNTATQFILVREYWPVMDRPLAMEGRTQNILRDVEKFTIEYLDTTNEWREIWPPAGSVTAGTIPTELPRAIRYRIESAVFGPIERLVEVPQ